MNRVLLCEGKTDAILLSYYIERTCGWFHSSKVPKNLNITIEEKNNQSAFWYKKGEDYLLICGVGGKNNFRNFFIENIQPIIINYPESEGFSRIAIVIDRDDRSETSIRDSIKSAVSPIFNYVENNKWCTNKFEDTFGKILTIDFFLLIIPSDKQGALETLLLDSISEDVYNKQIVESSHRFVDDVAVNASKYIYSPRLNLKTRLGVTFAVLSPEKVFSFIDELIRSVKWEESLLLANCFENLKEI